MSRSAAHDERNKTFRDSFSDPENFAGTSTTSEVITEQAKKLGLDHRVESVTGSDGTRIHWLGHQDSSKVLLYYHGGGFMIPPLEGHALFWSAIIKALESRNKKIVIAAVEYSLTPKAKYPTQVVQGIEALRFILQKGYKPSEIVMGGDSAGGNLSLAVASAILHPFPGSESLKLTGPLAGMLLISPWVSYSVEGKSWDENAKNDSITAGGALVTSGAYVEVAARDNYSEPIRAETSWWHSMPVKHVLNIFGGYECFRDDMREMGTRISNAGVDIENTECPLEVHIDCLLDLQCRLEPGLMYTRSLEWLAEVF